MTKYKDTIIESDEDKVDQKFRSALYKNEHQLLDEAGDYAGTELTMKMNNIKDDKPHHIGTFLTIIINYFFIF